MSYFVYILKSEKTGRYYVGQTYNLQNRLQAHNSGKNKSTKHGSPWVLVYHEEHDSRPEAVRREKKIKSYKGGRAFKALVQS